jgi:hypothetical protein
MPHSSYLSFQALDRLLGKPVAEYHRKIRDLKILRIGPMVEYYLHDRNAASAFYRASPSTATASLLKIERLNHLNELPAPRTSHSLEVEFFKSPQVESELEDSRYDAFLNRLRHAALQAGLERTFSAALTATFGEMVNNLVIHCEAPQTAVIGYRHSKPEKEFEYVVADQGIGVLASLKQNPIYHYLLDSGQALETAIKDGESRRGKNIGCGNGFQQLMRNIASQNSYLRFRSGDHSLTLDGIDKPHIDARTQQTVEFQGFLISVVCKI